MSGSNEDAYDLEEMAGSGSRAENGGGGKLRDTKKLTGRGERMRNGKKLGLGPEKKPKVHHSTKNNGGVPPSLHTPCYSQHSPYQRVPDSSSSSSSSPSISFRRNRASDLLMAVSLGAEEKRIKIDELAQSAMEELTRKVLEGEPLWQYQVGSEIETLNEAEYIRDFRAFDATLREIMKMIEVEDSQSFAYLEGNYALINRGQHKYSLREIVGMDVLQLEASREIGFVNMNASRIIECLMDLDQWSIAFSKIVSNATLLGVLSEGSIAGNYDETLQVMSAEFHMPTPLVPVRECQFARYCKQLGSTTWGVVDVSLETVFPYPIVRFQRRPSGCLIKEMPNGCCKITWVEHVEVDNSLVPKVFQPPVVSGFAFSAKRWLATLIQHYEGISTLMSETPLLVDEGFISQKGKRSLLMLAEKMMRKFCEDLSASTNNFWMPFPVAGAEDFRLMTKSIGATSGCPFTTIAFTHSIWISAPPSRVFDFLRHEDCRTKWDLLSRHLEIQELAQITKGENQENIISITKTINERTHKLETLYLQESYSDPTASYVVYAPFDSDSMETILKGGNPDEMNILPSGFVIHPDKLITDNVVDEEERGCILTLSFHIVDSSSIKNRVSAQSVDTVYKILKETAYLIKSAVLYDDDDDDS